MHSAAAEHLRAPELSPAGRSVFALWSTGMHHVFFTPYIIACSLCYIFRLLTYFLSFFLGYFHVALRKQNKNIPHAQTQGASNALLIAADQDRPAIVKVILQYWTGEDEMVNLLVFMSCAYVCMCEGVQF
jgi:cbb3-type cytochrome oxidase subunit 3